LAGFGSSDEAAVHHLSIKVSKVVSRPCRETRLAATALAQCENRQADEAAAGLSLHISAHASGDQGRREIVQLARQRYHGPPGPERGAVSGATLSAMR
jgi:hypothetical protein